MNKHSLPNFYSIIPSKVRYSKQLSSLDKIIFSEITALTNALGYCYAYNKYFEVAFNVSTRTVQRAIKKLEDRGFITIEIIKDENQAVKERKIYINEGVTPHVKIDGTPHDKNDGVARVPASKNNTRYNKSYKYDYSAFKNSKPKDVEIEWLDEYIANLE